MVYHKIFKVMERECGCLKKFKVKNISVTFHSSKHCKLASKISATITANRIEKKVYQFYFMGKLMNKDEK